MQKGVVVLERLGIWVVWGWGKVKESRSKAISRAGKQTPPEEFYLIAWKREIYLPYTTEIQTNNINRFRTGAKGEGKIVQLIAS